MEKWQERRFFTIWEYLSYKITMTYGVSELQEVGRDEFRQRCLEKIPSWYKPLFHLLVPSLFGSLVIFGSSFLIKDLKMVELITVPLTYFISNLLEWLAHKNLLHKRSSLAPVLYEQHTPIHHRIYVTEDMSIHSAKEFRLVLIPAYGIMLIFLINLPLTTILYFLLGPNVAALFVMTSMAYVVGYEWLHLSYHLSKDHFITRLGIVRQLSHHHAIHHDPKLMQRWNMNVTVPLWDFILRTTYRS